MSNYDGDYDWGVIGCTPCMIAIIAALATAYSLSIFTLGMIIGFAL